MTDRVKGRHPRQPVGEERQDDQAQIDIGENMDDLVGPGRIPVLAQGRQFHIGQPKPHRTGVGDDQQQEDHDSQTADEMGRSPPEEKALGDGFDVVQDRGAGGRIAGYALEPGVLDGERTAPQGVGQHPDDERKDPGQADDHVAVLHRDLGRFLDEDEGEDADREGDDETDQQRHHGTVPSVEKGDEDREQHEERTD